VCGFYKRREKIPIFFGGEKVRKAGYSSSNQYSILAWIIEREEFEV